MAVRIRYCAEFLKSSSIVVCDKCLFPNIKIYRMSDGGALCGKCVDDSHWMDNFVYIRTELPDLIYEDFRISEVTIVNNEYRHVWQESIREAMRFAKTKI